MVRPFRSHRVHWRHGGLFIRQEQAASVRSSLWYVDSEGVCSQGSRTGASMIGSLLHGEVVMDSKTFIGLSLVCSLLVPPFVFVHSAAWGGCTAQERIELGKQGYDREQVDRACADVEENFWESLGKGLATELANGVTRELSRALGVRESTYRDSTSATAGARVCVTDGGTCPLSGGPTGYPCYCRTWNGLTFTGLSK